MMFKVAASADIYTYGVIMSIHGTKTDWDDLPYQDENGKWHNQGKMFNVAFEWNKDPQELARTLTLAINSLMEVMNQGVIIMDEKAPSFGLPNNQNPEPHAPAHYGNLHVPHPTNAAAKVVHPEKVMSQTLKAK